MHIWWLLRHLVLQDLKQFSADQHIMAAPPMVLQRLMSQELSLHAHLFLGSVWQEQGNG